MAYLDLILSATTRHNPRHVEAFMRAEHGTLDALSPGAFRAEALAAAACVDQAGFDFSEKLAQSFGL